MKRQWRAVALWGPLLIQWSLYDPQGWPIDRLVLYRNVNGGPFSAYATIRDIAATSVSDSQVKKNHHYCYYITAVTSDGQESLVQGNACAEPIK